MSPGARSAFRTGLYLFLVGAAYEIAVLLYDSFGRADTVISQPDPFRKSRIDLAFWVAEFVHHGECNYPPSYGIVGLTALVALSGLTAVGVGGFVLAAVRAGRRLLRS